MQKTDFSWLDIAVKTWISVKTTLLSTPWNATISRINSHKIRINSKRQLTLWKIKMSSEGSAHEIVQKQNTNFVCSTLDFCNMQKKTFIHEKNERKLLLPAMCFTQNWVKGGLRAHTPCLSKRRARQHFVRSFDAKLRKGVRVYYCDLKILHPEIVGSKNEDDFLCKKVVKMDDFLNVCWFLQDF